MFVKLYSSMILSSVWSEDPEVRVLWITMLAQADRDGFLFGSPAGLAAVARLPIEAVHRGLKKFMEPDPESSDLLRNPENEGRRIEPIEGGWKLINYDFYRGLERTEDRRAQYRESKRRTRARKAVDRPRKSRRVSKSPPSEAEAEADTEILSPNGPPPVQEISRQQSTVATSARKNGFQRPTLEECWKHATEKGWVTAGLIDPPEFYSYWEGRGWSFGTGKPMKDWKATMWNLARRREAERKP